jgi:hypothetical protein
LHRLAALLERVADHCRDGALLTLPPGGDVLAFRRWVAEEVERQMAGGSPSPFADGRR